MLKSSKSKSRINPNYRPNLRESGLRNRISTPMSVNGGTELDKVSFTSFAPSFNKTSIKCFKTIDLKVEKEVTTPDCGKHYLISGKSQ